MEIGKINFSGTLSFNYCPHCGNKITKPEDKFKEFYCGNRTKNHCLWDSIPEKDKGKPMGISCPCKKCSPHNILPDIRG